MPETAVFCYGRARRLAGGARIAVLLGEEDDSAARSHTTEALPMWFERHVAADSVKLAFQIVDAPAVEGAT